MIEISIDLLIKGIGVLSLILAILSIYILLNGAKENAALRKKERYLQSNEELWYRYFKDEIDLPAELIPKDDADIQAVEEIFFSYVQNLSSPVVKEKIQKFSNQYLWQHYLKLLSSKKWSLRMNALYRVVSFEIDSLFDECKKLEKRPEVSPEERYFLLVIRSIFDEAGFIEEFTNLSTDLSEYEYKKLLIGFDSEVLEQLTCQMSDFPEEYQYYFIDVLGIKRNLNFVPFLESNLYHENVEIRIRSLKAINEIGIVDDLDKYKVFLNSPIWEERMMLAKLLGAFPLEEVYPFLEQLLQDNNWWVRSNAARSISHSKDGKSRLERFIETAQDRYAIEMAREVLGRG